MSIKIITTEFHKKISEEMLKFAKAELKSLKIKDVEVIKIPGSFEVPLIAQEVLANPKTEALVVLGYIEKGETLHGEIMGNVVHNKLVELSLRYRKPVGFGIIGPGATLSQAKVRTEGTAKRAVRGVVQSLKTLKRIA